MSKFHSSGSDRGRNRGKEGETLGVPGAVQNISFYWDRGSHPWCSGSFGIGPARIAGGGFELRGSPPPRDLAE